jgi:glycosyltransferase involved in cell wall biosynthesis
VSHALDQQPDALDRMGRSSREIVEREFAWAAVIQRILDLYDEILSGRT